MQVAVDRADDVRGADRGEDVEGVLGAGQLGVDDRALGDLAQPGDELAGLVDRDQRVVRAVEDEEVRGVRGDPQERAGGLEDVGSSAQVVFMTPRRRNRSRIWLGGLVPVEPAMS